MVILLDNARSAEQVEDLLPGTGSSFVLVTSRERLGRLAVKYAARRVTLAPLADADALGLLADAVGAERVSAEAPAARRLAQLCDHLPFALRIAAEQLVTARGGSIADLVGNLEDAHQRLDTLRLENDDLCSVRSVMACSFDALDPDTARACRMLGAFPGVSITRHCAAALLDVPVPRASELLQRLSAQHLLEQHGDRYTMHDLTRTSIRELARSLPDGEVRAARDRVSAWYTATLSRMVGAGRRRIIEVGADAGSWCHEPQPFGGQEEFLRWCAQEWPNISALIRSTARSGDHLSTWRLTYLMFDYFYACGSAADWLDLLRIATRSAQASGERRARAVLLNHTVGHCRIGRRRRGGRPVPWAGSAGAFRRSTAAYQAAGNAGLGIAGGEGVRAGAGRGAGSGGAVRGLGDGYHRAAAEDALCEVYAETGRWSEAVAHAEAGLADARVCKSPLLEANLLINLGLARNGLGDAAAAQACLARALRVTQLRATGITKGWRCWPWRGSGRRSAGRPRRWPGGRWRSSRSWRPRRPRTCWKFLGILQLAGSVAAA